jgi:hypothetical protein
VIRVWNVNQRKVIAWHDTKEFITALSYNKPVLVAGLVSGDIVVSRSTAKTEPEFTLKVGKLPVLSFTMRLWSA